MMQPLCIPRAVSLLFLYNVKNQMHHINSATTQLELVDNRRQKPAVVDKKKIFSPPFLSLPSLPFLPFPLWKGKGKGGEKEGERKKDAED